MVDNFDLLRPKLTFEKLVEARLDPSTNKLKDVHYYDVDQYDIHVLRRVKDCKALGQKVGANECTRLLRTYEIKSIEAFDQKKEAIKELCRTNNARAYLLLQVRDSRDYQLNLGRNLLECIAKKNYGLKAEHLARTSFCEMHISRKKVWMLDIDNEEMHGWSRAEVHEILKDNLVKCGKDPNEVYEVPTVHGFHIITPPFDTKAANDACPMIFKDQKKGYDYDLTEKWLSENLFKKMSCTISQEALNRLNSTMKDLIRNPFLIDELENALKELWLSGIRCNIEDLRKTCKKQIPGWLHKDATTLLYAP